MKKMTEKKRQGLYGQTGSHYTNKELKALRAIFIDGFKQEKLRRSAE